MTDKQKLFIDRVLTRLLGGHISIGRLTIFGRNAMHFAINYKRKNGMYVCFRLPLFCFGKWWPLHFYISEDATPQGSSFIIPKSYRWG